MSPNPSRSSNPGWKRLPSIAGNTIAPWERSSPAILLETKGQNDVLVLAGNEFMKITHFQERRRGKMTQAITLEVFSDYV
jgi:hypothetical protein